MNGVTYIDILHNPKNVIPSLSEKEITLIVTEMILSYIERKINLKVLSEVAILIKNYSLNSLSKNIKKDLEEISTMYVNEIVLTDILEELNKAKH